MILAGDLGGTKSNLGLFEVQDGRFRKLTSHRYSSQSFSSAEEIVGDFLRDTSAKVCLACFDVAGPVVNNHAHVTNLPWEVDGGHLAKILGLARVPLINDLEATSYGVLLLDHSELETLHAGVPLANATKAVIAAGTGLGESILFYDGARYIPIPTEAGHADFAPHTVEQAEFWRFLKARFESVSNEVILSGRGFRELHDFLGPSSPHPNFDQPGFDPAPEITNAALEKSCPICVQVLDFWVDIYGSEAGNLALRSVARGGVYVAGGIGVKILPKLRDGRFAAAFTQKEKLGNFLRQIPIYIVLNEEAPLLGAAHVALERA